MYCLLIPLIEKVVGRVFEITDYGVCFLDDILSGSS